MDDLIRRQDAIDALTEENLFKHMDTVNDGGQENRSAIRIIKSLPSAQPTIYGYNIEHLVLIARVLQKENLSPERVVEILTDIGGIVTIVKDEFEEVLRKAVEQCTI